MNKITLADFRQEAPSGSVILYQDGGYDGKSLELNIAKLKEPFVNLGDLDWNDRTSSI